jgi:hypothetical protein
MGSNAYSITGTAGCGRDCDGNVNVGGADNGANVRVGMEREVDAADILDGPKKKETTNGMQLTSLGSRLHLLDLGSRCGGLLRSGSRSCVGAGAVG